MDAVLLGQFSLRHFFTGQRGVLVEAEDRAMLLRLAATHFGSETGSLEVEHAGGRVRLQAEVGEGRGRFVVLVEDAEIGEYWVGGSGEFLILP